MHNGDCDGIHLEFSQEGVGNNMVGCRFQGDVMVIIFPSVMFPFVGFFLLGKFGAFAQISGSGSFYFSLANIGRIWMDMVGWSPTSRVTA